MKKEPCAEISYEKDNIGGCHFSLDYYPQGYNKVTFVQAMKYVSSPSMDNFFSFLFIILIILCGIFSLVGIACSQMIIAIPSALALIILCAVAYIAVNATGMAKNAAEKISLVSFYYIHISRRDTILGTLADIKAYSPAATAMANAAYKDILLQMAQMLYEVEKTYGKDKTSHTEAMLTIKHMLRSQMDLIQQGIATPDVDTINLRNAQDVMKATRKAIEEINTFK